jgi:hypothetical protein
MSNFPNPYVRRGSDPNGYPTTQDEVPYSDDGTGYTYSTSTMQAPTQGTSLYGGSYGTNGSNYSIRSLSSTGSNRHRTEPRPYVRSNNPPSELPSLAESVSTISEQTGTSRSLNHPSEFAIENLQAYGWDAATGRNFPAAVPRVPNPNEGFPCLFWFDNCHEHPSFHTWISHVNEHLMDIVPPAHSKCGVCEAVYEHEGSPRANWDRLLSHIMTRHYTQSAEHRPYIQPPDVFVQYLEDNQLVNPVVAARARHGHATSLHTRVVQSRHHGNDNSVQYYGGLRRRGEGYEAVTVDRSRVQDLNLLRGTGGWSRQQR